MSNGDQSSELMEEVMDIRVHTKVTKGGRNLSFSALVAVGNGRGKVGVGYGKARGVPMAIEKAIKRARSEMKKINLIGDTIAHEIIGKHASSEVLIKPASPGTGVKAGATVRSMMKVLGVQNVLSKSFGRNNPLNLAKATMNALTRLRSPEEIEKVRGVKPQMDHPQLSVTRRKEAPEEAEEVVREEAVGEEEAAEEAAPEETAEAGEVEPMEVTEEAEEGAEQAEEGLEEGEEERAAAEESDEDSKGAAEEQTADEGTEDEAEGEKEEEAEKETEGEAEPESRE